MLICLIRQCLESMIPVFLADYPFPGKCHWYEFAHCPQFLALKGADSGCKPAESGPVDGRYLTGVL